MVEIVAIHELAKKLFFDPPVGGEKSHEKNSSRQIASNNKSFAKS